MIATAKMALKIPSQVRITGGLLSTTYQAPRLTGQDNLWHLPTAPGSTVTVTLSQGEMAPEVQPLPYMNMRELQVTHPLAEKFAALAAEIRHDVVASTAKAGAGHPGGSLSVADMLAVLYSNHLKFDRNQPLNPNRDRFVMSKGHAAPALYSILAQAGFFPREDLLGLRNVAAQRLAQSTMTPLEGHPDMEKTPGVDFATGRLGLGMSAAVGMAVAAKMDKKDNLVFFCIGDGEAQEGLVTEAAEYAGRQKLNNLIGFLDLNGLQIDGDTADVTATDQVKKFLDMGWQVIEVNGHDHGQLDLAIENAKASTDKPTLIVMHTVKGKGVSFMENNPGFHGVVTKGQQTVDALAEIEKTRRPNLVADLTRRMSGQELLPQAVLPVFKELAIDASPWHKKQATRSSFGDWLMAAMAQNDRIVGIQPDLSKSVMTAEVEKKFGVFGLQDGGRCVRVGIKEQLMVGMGAGLATCGFIPVMAGFAKFWDVPGDLVNQTFGKYGLAGLAIGTHGGTQVGRDGPTHMDLVSLITMGAHLDGEVYEPGDAFTTVSLLTQRFNTMVARLNRTDETPANRLFHHRPAYFRLTRSDLADCPDGAADFSSGVGFRLLGDEVASKPAVEKVITIVASGAMLEVARRAAQVINGDLTVPSTVRRVIDAFQPSETGLAQIGSFLSGSTRVITLTDALPGTLGLPVAAALLKAKKTPTLIQLGPKQHEICSGDPAEVLKLLRLDVDGLVGRIRDLK